MSAISLEGKVAVVTGATGGWGSGAAMALAARGATVVVNARTRARVEAVAAFIRESGGKVTGVAHDVSTFEGATRLMNEAISAHGRIDCLVNAAGVRLTDTNATDNKGIYGGGLLDMDEAKWRAVMDAELNIIFNCTKAAAKQMVSQGQGGSVMTVLGNVVGLAGKSAHCAAKAAALSCINSWADELTPYGITVNGLGGYVRSILTDPLFDNGDDSFRTKRERGTLPLEPAHAGEIVAWLASQDASDITGRYLFLDGERASMWEQRLPEVQVFREGGWSAEDMAQRFAPIVRRRPASPHFTDQLMDLFDNRDRGRAANERAEVEALKAGSAAAAAS